MEATKRQSAWFVLWMQDFIRRQSLKLWKLTQKCKPNQDFPLLSSIKITLLGNKMTALIASEAVFKHLFSCWYAELRCTKFKNSLLSCSLVLHAVMNVSGTLHLMACNQIIRESKDLNIHRQTWNVVFTLLTVQCLTDNSEFCIRNKSLPLSIQDPLLNLN